MQTSAKTKAKEFVYQNRELFRNFTTNEKKHFKRDLEELLSEHERDTRYTAIDVLSSMEVFEASTGCVELNGDDITLTTVDLYEATSLIHNLKVGV
ncbi:coil containing protein [Vibrio phage 1.084.O._10N.261.49.F5]|nr:coil containing protein [Vibrio phage 1.084.O._10N.261.49.F5]